MQVALHISWEDNHALPIGQVELRLSVETSGHDHRVRVLKALKDAGLQAKIEEG
jgi:hypothetical protein